jgi:hypothetical protein
MFYPALCLLREVLVLISTAILSFQDAGGRDAVNVKLKEIESMEDSKRGFFGFGKKKLSKEALVVREDLTQILMYMHLLQNG